MFTGRLPVFATVMLNLLFGTDTPVTWIFSWLEFDSCWFFEITELSYWFRVFMLNET